eukprot:TRINITY_DN12679_c0_g1_i1.p1 TRINITY_DN12679_c0_g1~~TRINITY_DN12679_c0_g1_i1.p1  ORF type:complete len:171 (-),score=57.03 TRINITY_DN12679_c0_g1_i1:145-657(-)
MSETESVVVQSQENEEKPLSYTEASYKTKGDKSYYYWHGKVSKTVPIGAPQLLESTICEVPSAPVFKNITAYSWLDDGGFVKLYVEFAKLGDPTVELGEVAAEDVLCTFSENGFDLQMLKVRNQDHQLKISRLKEKIDPEKSTFKKLKGKVIVSCKKVDESNKWTSLFAK